MYTWSQNTPIDSTGKARSPYGSLFKNIRYALSYSRSITITLAEMANLPGIAYREYGSEDAFYLILAYNGLTDPLTDIYPGIQLRLFTKTSLDAYISAQKTPASSTRQRTLRI